MTADDEQLFQHESAIREVDQNIFEMASNIPRLRDADVELA